MSSTRPGDAMSATTAELHQRKTDPQRALGRLGIYILLALWAFICIFPLYWTITTSVKSREAVIQGPKYIPYVDFQPDNKGWFPLLYEAGARSQFLKHFQDTLPEREDHIFFASKVLGTSMELSGLIILDIGTLVMVKAM